MSIDLAPLLNVGAVGVILAWHLFRTESRLDRMERAIDRMVRAQMIEVAAGLQVPEPVREQARAVLSEMGGNGAKH